jgi:hypothetical protein
MTPAALNAMDSLGAPTAAECDILIIGGGPAGATAAILAHPTRGAQPRGHYPARARTHDQRLMARA